MKEKRCKYVVSSNEILQRFVSISIGDFYDEEFPS